MADMRGRSPEPPAGMPRVEFKPGLADETLRELAPLLAKEGWPHTAVGSPLDRRTVGRPTSDRRRGVGRGSCCLVRVSTARCLGSRAPGARAREHWVTPGASRPRRRRTLLDNRARGPLQDLEDHMKVRRAVVSVAVLFAATGLTTLAAGADEGRSVFTPPAVSGLARPGKVFTPPPPLDAATAQLMEQQERLDGAGEAILAVESRLTDSGYGGMAASPADRVLNVYWSGPVPASVEQVISDLPVRVILRAAPYSKRRLDVVAGQLATNAALRAAGLSEVAVAPDASGLEVHASDPTAAREAIAGITDGIPVRFGPAQDLLLGSRWSDSPPVWGARVDRLVTGVSVRSAAVDALLPHGTDGVCRATAHGWQQLRALQSRIEQDFRQLARDGIIVTVVGPSVSADKVEVAVSPQSRQDAEAVLSSRYGEAVEVSREQVAQAMQGR